MRTVTAVIFIAFASPALAQQPQITPSQMAIQIDNAVNGLASSVEVLQAQLKQVQTQLQACPKPEPNKDAPKK